MDRKLAAGLGIGALLAAAVLWVTLAGGGEGTEAGPTTKTQSDSEANARTPVLRGRVVNGIGQSVAEATVTTGEHRVTTDADGNFAFYELPSGDHELDVEHERYVAPGPKPIRVAEVRIPPADQREGPKSVKLTVREPAKVSGRVVASGQPVGGAQISLYYAHTDGLVDPLKPFVLNAVSQTGSDGRFSMQVAPGRLQVIAESGEFGSKRSREMYLEGGAVKEDVVIDLAPTGMVAGTVVDNQGNPIRAELRLDGPRLPTPQRTRSAEDGSFVFDTLSRGTYRLEARAQGHRSQIAEGLEVRADEVTRRTLRLQSVEGLFGRVFGPEGDPVTGAFVRLDGPGEHETWRRSGKSGVFRWPNAPEGRWTAKAYSPAYGPSQMVAGQTGTELRLKLRPGGYVRGKILDTNGQPVPGAMLGVGAYSVDGPMPYRSRGIGRKRVTKENGTFRYGPLRPGTYELVARADGYATAASYEITVRAGSTAGPVTITLGQGAVVRGTVRDAKSGKPLAGAQVSVFDMTSPFKPRSAQTDQKGRFEMKKVPGGRRSLRVSYDGYLTRVLSGLQIPAGGTFEQSVTLRKKKKGERFSFRGIGATLRKTEDGPVVQGTIKGGGARRNGLKRGDVISAVDGERVTDWPLPKVIQKIRGRGGEPVKLRIERDGRRFNVEIVRGRVVVEGRN